MDNKEIVQILLQEALPYILIDVRPEDSAAVTTMFERLLKTALDKDRSVVPDPDAMGIRIGRRIIEKILGIAPEKRLEYIQQELFDSEISDLDRIARKIAERSVYTSQDLPALRTQAKVVLERIEELRSGFTQNKVDWKPRYGLTFSEIRLDCGFVLGKHHYSSMRLGRTIELLKRRGEWPPAWYAELWLENKDNK